MTVTRGTRVPQAASGSNRAPGASTKALAKSAGISEDLLNSMPDPQKPVETDGKKAWEEGNYAEAVSRWERSLKSIDYIFEKSGYKEGSKQYNDTLAIKKKTHLNVAQGYIKLRKFDKAVDSCDVVLKDEATHEKALYRKAVAFQGQTAYSKAMEVLRELLAAHPGNKAAIQLLNEVTHADAKFRKESKTVWKHVLGNLEHDERVPPTKWEQTMQDIHPKNLYQKFWELLADMKTEFLELCGEFASQFESACPRRAPATSPRADDDSNKSVPDISREVSARMGCSDSKSDKITEVVD